VTVDGGHLGFPSRRDIHAECDGVIRHGANLRHVHRLSERLRNGDGVERGHVRGSAKGLGGKLADGNVVGVAGDSIGAVGQHRLRAHFTHHGENLGDDGFGIGLGQMTVLVIQQARRLDAQRRTGAAQFTLAHSGQFLGRAQRRVAA
jgi:hypothetical protein